MRVSLRLILIPDDQGRGQNVKPLAQQELAQFDSNERADPRLAMVMLATAAQDAVKPLLLIGNPKREQK